MKKIFHLSTCSTCQRILKAWNPGPEFARQDIKSVAISEADLDRMAELAGSYASLFSRRAMKFRALGLHEQQLTEQDYKKLILEEYTFLKRPVLVFNDQIFVGNSKKVVEAATQALHG